MTPLRKKMIGCFCPLLAGLFCLGLLDFSAALASNQESLAEDTMLMFVGEEKRVSTVASVEPEEAVDAPAMIRVIERGEILSKGYQTLAELLAAQPGFYLPIQGRGTMSYLRGLANAVLFLYDGVPMTTDVTRGLSVLDREISLSPVQRVEITYGPGSVLWGADAYAGVVNIVPLRGRQVQGGEISLHGQTKQTGGIDLLWGKLAANWDSLLAFSGTEQRYHQDEYVQRQDGRETVYAHLEPSDYAELVGTLHFGNWLQVTGRWSDFSRFYSMRSVHDEVRWAGQKAAPVNFVKASLHKVLGPSHYSLMGFMQEIDYFVQDSDVQWEQSSHMDHLELLWDRRFLSRGLCTLGGSWRKNKVSGAVVRDGFFPDFLTQSMPLFVPQIQQEDFNTERSSLFGQGRYRWGSTEWWAGARYDTHNQYGVTKSYSLGGNWRFSKDMRLKVSYGNAFRSPFSSQIFELEVLEPESIKTVNAHFAWSLDKNRFLELTLFQNRLYDHRVEDPYGGLSESSTQQTLGCEFAGRFPLAKNVSLHAEGLLLDHSDGEELFVTTFSFVQPDGSEKQDFDLWSKPFNQGAQWLVSAGVEMRLGPQDEVTLQGHFRGKVPYSYDKGEVQGEYSQPVLLDVSYSRMGVFSHHDSLQLQVKNLLDQNYQVPDTFGPTSGLPLQIQLLWRITL